MLNPNYGGVVLYPEEVATLLDTGFLARVERLAPAEFAVRPAQAAPAWLAPAISGSLEHADFVSSASSPGNSLVRRRTASRSVDLAGGGPGFRRAGGSSGDHRHTALMLRFDVIIDLAVHDVSLPLPAGLDDPQIPPIFFTRIKPT